jgi:transcriptional regulator with XRE-family HTH domain
VKGLREWRIERLLSLAALAEQSGVTKKTLIDIEHGRRLPHYATIAALCRVLDVSPAEVSEFTAALKGRSRVAAETTPRPHPGKRPPVGRASGRTGRKVADGTHDDP